MLRTQKVALEKPSKNGDLGSNFTTVLQLNLVRLDHVFFFAVCSMHFASLPIRILDCHVTASSV